MARKFTDDHVKMKRKGKPESPIKLISCAHIRQLVKDNKIGDFGFEFADRKACDYFRDWMAETDHIEEQRRGKGSILPGVSGISTVAPLGGEAPPEPGIAGSSPADEEAIEEEEYKPRSALDGD